MTAYKRILVAVDGSETSNLALTAAAGLVHDAGPEARLHIVHSIDALLYMAGYECPVDMTDVLRQQGEALLTQSKQAAASIGAEADTELIDKPGMRLGDVIADVAQRWQADLVVVGTHGRRGVGRVLLGSGAEQILRLAPVPVLVVRG